MSNRNKTLRLTLVRALEHTKSLEFLSSGKQIGDWYLEQSNLFMESKTWRG